jgi:hypothetical protein
MSGDIPQVSYIPLHGMEMAHLTLGLILSVSGCSMQHNVGNNIRIFINLGVLVVPY